MAYIDYYKTLGVAKTATQAQIKTAYRKLARENHPDLNANDKGAEKRFKVINEANEVLSNSENRSKYDRQGQNWKQSGSRGNQNYQGGYSDFFESMFGGARNSQSSASVKGQDLKTQASLNIRDILESQKRTLNLGGKNIRFTVPAGINDGQEIKIKGHGGEGLNGGPKGDLYIKFKIKNDTNFTRKGNDLHLKYDLDLYTALLGGKITVDTLTGKVKLKIKPETKNGATETIKYEGMPFYKNENQFGDLVVTYTIEIPENLSKKEKELFEELAKLSSAN